MGEELGWRGYALPRLLSGRLNSLTAALVLGIIWGIWHLPAFFIAGTSQHDDQMGIFWLILGTTLSSVIMTWLYIRTKGDVLASGLLVHFMNNFTSARLPYLDLVYTPLALAAGVALTRSNKAEADVQQTTGIDRAALCRIESGENGNPTVNTLLRYARAIGRKINVTLVEADPVKA
jgi:hypothetical protein